MTDRGQITEMLSLSLEKYINPQNAPRIYKIIQRESCRIHACR